MKAKHREIIIQYNSLHKKNYTDTFIADLIGVSRKELISALNKHTESLGQSEINTFSKRSSYWDKEEHIIQALEPSYNSNDLTGVELELLNIKRNT